MSTVQSVELNPELTDVIPKIHKKTVTTWKGAQMIRAHSLLVTVREILQMLNSLDVVKIGIVGEPSTGKTTLALILSHLIHDMSKLPWALRVFGEEEFLDMRATINSLEPANYVLYFHDLSFLTDKRKIEEVKAAITKIRHLKSDVKIVLIYDYHYTLGLDKYLRQFNFLYLTSMGSSEMDNVLKIVGNKYTGLIEDFKEKYVEQSTRQKCTFSVGMNKFFIYNYKDPFVVALFYNNSRARYIIFPKREWLCKICSTCSKANSQLANRTISAADFRKEMDAKWGTTFKSALKLHLFSNGLNVYSPHIVQAQRFLSKALMTKYIDLEELALAYDLKITKTYMRKKLDGILAT